MIIIKNGDVVLEESIMHGDVAIDEGIIVAIESWIEPTKQDTCIDATGAYIFPGFIDGHTHFQMTNSLATTADSFQTGSVAAVMGGTTTIINFASPVATGSMYDGLLENIEKAHGNCACNYKFHMEITHVDSDSLADIEKVALGGVTSFKAYMAYAFSLEDRELYQAIQAVRNVDGLIGAHCENGQLIECLTAEARRKGHLSVRYHPKVRPPITEAEAINRFITTGRLLDYPVHIVHVSSAVGLECIRRQRKEGAKVTAETCPQYLYLMADLYSLPHGEGLKYLCSPPLRQGIDVHALRTGVMNGEFDTIATDHCSYRWNTQKMKGKEDFTKAPGGLPGVEERIQLMYSLLVKKGDMTPIKFAHLHSTNAAKLYKMYPKKGILSVGSDADVTVYQKEGLETITASTRHANTDYTPYEGIQVKGYVRHVLVNGNLVVKDRELIEKNSGSYVK